MIKAIQGLASHLEIQAAFTETTSHPDNVFKWMKMNFFQLDTRQLRRTQQPVLTRMILSWKTWKTVIAPF
ncbi:hypothetical protein DPMN_101686 [Dreissena polymorpha]|uniref:Uncharacterized protein n=1 Tax=Dreissena polymorpha TaxID=45954 RepID=A0A9D4LI11_DREPO|nr:hypothetical protein DPMN_101686 [Dreissena polymorpha]